MSAIKKTVPKKTVSNKTSLVDHILQNYSQFNLGNNEKYNKKTENSKANNTQKFDYYVCVKIPNTQSKIQNGKRSSCKEPKVNNKEQHSCGHCKNLKPKRGVCNQENRMSAKSTMNTSYQPIHNFVPVESFKPENFYMKPEMPIEGTSIKKMSYLPWPVPGKEDYPWVPRGVYNRPSMRMEGNTMYTYSYRPSKEDGRRIPIRHGDSENILGAEKIFEDRTIYRQSFLPAKEDCRENAVPPSDNLTSGNSKFANMTTTKHDYRGWPGVAKTDLIIPDRRSFLGDGHMHLLTTHKHDFTPKPIYRVGGILPSNSIRLSDKHMEHTSTMTASYQPVPEYEQMENFKPLTTYRKPGMPMEDTTVNKLSYVPWPAPEKEDYPWVPHGQFQKPHVPMEGNTIYRNSYLTPGEFECDPEQLSVGGGDSGGDCCVCCPKDKQR